MGSKFAPRVANFFMSKWEEEKVYKSRSNQLKLHKRFIDDIIWQGDTDTLEEFTTNLDRNDKKAN